MLRRSTTFLQLRGLQTRPSPFTDIPAHLPLSGCHFSWLVLLVLLRLSQLCYRGGAIPSAIHTVHCLSCRDTFSSLQYHAKEKPPWFSCCPAHKDRASKSTGNRCAYYPTSSWAAPHSCSTPAEWNNTWWTHFTHPQVWQKHRGVLLQTCFRYIPGIKLHQFILDYLKNGKF